MKSLSFPLCFSLFFLFVQVTCLEIVVQPQTLAGGTSLAFWARDATDPTTFTLELHFYCASGTTDKGVAYPAFTVPPDQTFGAIPMVFPADGTFILKAVDPNTHQVLGVSNSVAAVAPSVAVTPAPLPAGPATTQPTSSTQSPASVTTNSPHSTASSTPTSTHSPVHAAERKSVNLPAVVGGVVGGIVLLGLLVALAIFIRRRRKDAVRRYTFHQDMMVQPHDASANGSHVTITQSNTSDHDVEAGPAAPPVAPIPTPVRNIPRIAVPYSAPAFNSLRHDLDRPHSPITPRTKRNFFAVTNSNPFNPEAEAFADSRPAAGSRISQDSLATMPPLPNPYTVESYNPFQDQRKEPEMVQVPPSPHVTTSAFGVPSPRGPRPSIRR